MPVIINLEDAEEVDGENEQLVALDDDSIGKSWCVPPGNCRRR
jgi:hypothetical protein